MNTLTQLVCPMCGKFSSYDFSPCEDRDIYAVEVKGLGRGKGVKVVDRYSILDPENEAVKKIGDRLLELFLDKGCIDPGDVYEILPEDEEEEYSDEVIGEYVDETDELQGRLTDSEKLNEELAELLIE